MAFLLGVALSPAHARDCPFHYNKKTITRLVVPTLKNSYGSNYVWYDLKNPTVLKNKGGVELIFLQSRPDVMDTPNFVIEIDSCRSKVIKAYETSPFPENSKR